MAYPARLEVTTLLAGSDEGADESCLSNADTSTLTPVADTSNTGAAPSPLFVIADDTNKRAKSAGVVGSGRVVPLGLGSKVRPNTQRATRLTVSPRPRSSPCIGRRYTRVTPLPTTTYPQPPTETQPTHSLLSCVADEVRDSGKSLTPSKLPKWSRERRKVSGLKNTNILDEGEVPWPTSSLDSEIMEHTSSTPAHPSSSDIPQENKSPWWGGSSPWIGGMYTVPTINIASDHSTPSTHKRWRQYCASSASDKSDCNTTLEHSRYVTERIHHLVSAFSQRASRVKAQITQPPTPSTELSEGADEAPKPRQRLDSMVGDQNSQSPSPSAMIGINSRKTRFLRKMKHYRRALKIPQGMEPQSTLYISWLFMVSIVYLYNAWVIPLRSVFSEYQHEDNLVYWLVSDYLADFVYVLDIVMFKSRIKYLDNGFWVSTPKLMRKYYMNTTNFIYDIASLMPLDLLYIQFGPISVFRLPRLLKIHTFWEFFNRLDTVLSSPHAVRVFRTVLNMLYMVHLNTCAYYGFSKVEGIGSNKWVFQGVGNAYVRCFYFATKTATSIGKNPKPENEAEYLFMTCSWLMGVFVFALLIGQIRDIVATATRNQNEYRAVMDHTQAYLHRLNVPPLLQERVRQWFTYTWHHKKTLDEMKCLESLPRKMRTDIAINVHIQTLSKVQLFQDCDKALLRDLVLKLRPVLYLSGDFVCKKGEVGKEMYIVQTGQVLVMGGEKGDVVLATLGEGSVFGEISLLALAGGNRRTANVRSRGFSNLFVLSKTDLQATIKDYPEAQEILRKKAKRLIRQNLALEKKETEDNENVIIKSRESTPKLLHTILQVVRPDSYTATVIRRSSRTISRSTIDIPSSGSLSPGGMWSWTPSPRLQWSSASLEVPTRSSRRSSFEVPSNASRAMIAKTSMSESLPEEDEDEEEEFLVVETSEISEESDDRPPASPGSQHSISLHRRSRSTTPQSVFSHTPSAISSPSNIDYLYQQPRGTPQFDQNRPPQHAYFFNQHHPDLESPMAEIEITSGKRSGTSSPKSCSSLSMYSPATLTRQSCIMGAQDSSPPFSTVADMTSVGQPPLSSDPLGILSPKTVQSKDSWKVDQHQRSRKTMANNINESSRRGSSAKTQDLNSHEEKGHQGRKHVPKSAGHNIPHSKTRAASVLFVQKDSDRILQTAVKNGKVMMSNKPTNPSTGSQNHEKKKDHNAAGHSSSTTNKGNKLNRASGNSKKSRNSGTSKSENYSKGSKSTTRSVGPGSLTYGRRSYTHYGESPKKVCKNKHDGNEVSNINSTDPKQQTNIPGNLKNSSRDDSEERNPHISLQKSRMIPGSLNKKDEVFTNHEDKPSSSSWSANEHHESQFNHGSNHGEATVSTVTLTKNLTSNTDDIIFKFGLGGTSDESGIITDTSNCIPSHEYPSDGDSYELFLSELTKTMPLKQVPSSTSQSSRPSSASLVDPTSPRGFNSSRIFCSAIVHRECTPSPETSPSPFDAKESRL